MMVDVGVSLRKIVAVLLIVAVAGCSGLSPLSLLTGGGPNVAANTQLGQNNEQVVGASSGSDFSIVRPQARDITQTSDDSKVKTESAEKIVVNENEPWIILLLIVGWLAPSPGEVGRRVRNLFNK